MKKVKVGVFGVGRGASLSEFFTVSENAEIVAVCDKWEDGLRRFEKQMNNPNIACFTSFDAFIEHDMDAVVLANYANEHARFAMTCLKKGKHVFSEVLPVQTMQEAVELVETVESSDRIYAYGENYCFMPAPREMRKLYRQGMLGEFEYGEGEYMHNCESIWPQITQGNPDHWRNNMYANFYCTHSIGPLIHITGQRPVKVTGFELPFDARMARCGAKAGACGIEMITLENGAILKHVAVRELTSETQNETEESYIMMEDGKVLQEILFSTTYDGVDTYYDSIMAGANEISLEEFDAMRQDLLGDAQEVGNVTFTPEDFVDFSDSDALNSYLLDLLSK